MLEISFAAVIEADVWHCAGKYSVCSIFQALQELRTFGIPTFAPLQPKNNNDSSEQLQCSDYVELVWKHLQQIWQMFALSFRSFSWLHLPNVAVTWNNEWFNHLQRSVLIQPRTGFHQLALHARQLRHLLFWSKWETIGISEKIRKPNQRPSQYCTY